MESNEFDPSTEIISPVSEFDNLLEIEDVQIRAIENSIYLTRLTAEISSGKYLEVEV